MARGTTRTDSRKQILDGAEQVFAEKGFYGSTTREIAEQSRVHLGLLGYYFPSKLDLYRAVIARRAEDYSNAIRSSMQQAAGGNGARTASPAELVEAYLRPMVDLSLNGGPGWKNYIRLLARAGNTRRTEPYVQTFMQTFNPISAEFIGLLKECFPEAEDQDIYWAHCFLAGAIINTMAETEAIDRLSGGVCKSSDLATMVDKLAPFFAAGMSRLVSAED